MSRSVLPLPKEGERALIVGQTGSGKTGFAVHMLERLTMSPVIIYDTKDESKFLALPKSIVVETMAQASVAYADMNIDYIIIRPPVEMLTEPEELDALLTYHYRHFPNSVAYVDEVYMFHNNGRGYKGIAALMTRGRSRGITTILASQRPKGFSRFIISESQKFYIFRLVDADDRKRFSDVIPDFHKVPMPPKFGFYYYESGEDEPKAYGPIALDKKYNTGYVDRATIAPDTLSSDAPDMPKNAPAHGWV